MMDYVYLDDLPYGWSCATLEELVSSKGIFCDGDWVESKDQDPNGNVRLIQLADIGDGSFKGKSSRFLTYDKAIDLNCTFLEKGDVLIARMPDPLGRACLFPMPGKNKYVTVVDVCVVRFGHELIEPIYLVHLINSPSIRNLIGEYQSGSTRKRISRKNLAKISLPIPPLNEQKRIVAKIEELFTELDAGIASLHTAQAQLKTYRQSLLKHAFEGKLTAAWREEHEAELEPAAALLQRIQNERQTRYEEELQQWQKGGTANKRKPSPPKDLPPLTPDDLAALPQLPFTWTYARLGDFIEAIEAGKSFKCEERQPSLNEIGVAKVSAVTWGEYDEAESKTCIDLEKINPSFFIHLGDFLFSRANTIELVGACVIAKQVTKKIMLSDKTLRIIFFGYSKSYFLQYLRCRTGRLEIMRLSTGNQESMRNIGQDRIHSIIVPICDRNEAEEIINCLEEKLSVLDQLEQSITTALQQAEALRQAILKKAFAGQLVPQDPHDEPASALLARIHTSQGNSRASLTKSL